MSSLSLNDDGQDGVAVEQEQEREQHQQHGEADGHGPQLQQPESTQYHDDKGVVDFDHSVQTIVADQDASKPVVEEADEMNGVQPDAVDQVPQDGEEVVEYDGMGEEGAYRTEDQNGIETQEETGYERTEAETGDPAAEEIAAVNGEASQEDQEAAAAAAAFDFLPFFPNGTSDMTRLAEAWQQQQMEAEAAAAAAAAAHQNGDEGEVRDIDGEEGGARDAPEPSEDGQNGEVKHGDHEGDAGLLLGMASDNSSQAVDRHHLQQALAFSGVSAPSSSAGFNADAPPFSPAGSQVAAAAAAAAAAQGVNPAYAIAAALAAQQQQRGGQWDYSQLTQHLSASSPYSNPSYAASVAAYNDSQQSAAASSSNSQHHQPNQKPQKERRMGSSLNPNTIGGHTHRPGSGHAFCTGPAVEGTSWRRFVFPLGPDVSAGRKKHVKSAQEMADTYPLADEPCERCAGYDNPLPCFHQPGSKCVYCKFLSKPCSLQPGGTNNKERRADGTQGGSAKKKRRTGEETSVDIIDQHHDPQQDMEAMAAAAGMTSSDQAQQVAQQLALAAHQHQEQLTQAQAAEAIQQAAEAHQRAQEAAGHDAGNGEEMQNLEQPEQDYSIVVGEQEQKEGFAAGLDGHDGHEQALPVEQPYEDVVYQHDEQDHPLLHVNGHGNVEEAAAAPAEGEDQHEGQYEGHAEGQYDGQGEGQHEDQAEGQQDGAVEGHYEGQDEEQNQGGEDGQTRFVVEEEEAATQNAEAKAEVSGALDASKWGSSEELGVDVFQDHQADANGLADVAQTLADANAQPAEQAAA
ncbi:unnamed protein product [Jaminaea pallidilutea]